jgi:hypothetical protein
VIIMQCPNGCPGVRAPERMRRDDVRRYCLDCSKRTGRLVKRDSPVLERRRAASVEHSQKKAATKRRAATRARVTAAERTDARYTVGDFDMRDALARMQRLSVFDHTHASHTWGPIDFTLSRSTQAKYVGRARYWERKITCTMSRDNPDAAKALELLLHEVCHIAVNTPDHHLPNGRRRRDVHGDAFKRMLIDAAEEMTGSVLDRQGTGHACYGVLDPSAERAIREWINTGARWPRKRAAARR